MSKVVSDSTEPRDVTRIMTAAGETGKIPDFESFMRRVFPDETSSLLDQDQVLLSAIPNQAVSLMRRDYETAFSMLHRASEAFPMLMRQCQSLESELRIIRSEAQAELDVAVNEKSRWQQLAVVLKNRLEDSDREVANLKERLAAAEDRLANGRQLASAAEQKASLAIGITTLFHDKIIESFGVGSPAHAALDALLTDVVRDPLHDIDLRPGKAD